MLQRIIIEQHGLEFSNLQLLFNSIESGDEINAECEGFREALDSVSHSTLLCKLQVTGYKLLESLKVYSPGCLTLLPTASR